VPDEGAPLRLAEAVRRRPDGSIDQAFYAAQARQLRSETCHQLLRRLMTRLFGLRRGG